MSALAFTPQEDALIRSYASTPKSAWTRVPGWLLEIGLPVACVIYGTTSGNRIFFGAAIGGLLGINIVRTFFQFKYTRLFSSICVKIQASRTPGNT